MSDKHHDAKVVITKNGPYLVTGNVPLSKKIIGANAKGESETWEEGEKYPAQEKYALCRCGHSKGKPYCDGTHAKVHFDGTETAPRAPYKMQAEVLDGPVMQLTDAEHLCAFGRFCDPNGQVWNQVESTDDPQVRANFIRQVGNCPAGRLVAWDKKTGKAIEPELPVSIGLIEDPVQKCSGPIWLRGGIPFVSADGTEYEVRNRVTLCRCGESQNKPYCDGTHASVKFHD
jgi:CDGSH-type Zn-finger protein